MTAEEARCLGGTFGRLHLATPYLQGHGRLAVAEHLSEQRWRDGWARVAEKLEGERVADGLLPARRPRPTLRFVRRRTLSKTPAPGTGVFDTIDPPTYVEALTGEPVPATGMIRCPLPGHEDRRPSFKVYDDPSRGWYCHGCHRGGTVIDLAAELTGIEPRGKGFHELRRYIAERLLLEAA